MVPWVMPWGDFVTFILPFLLVAFYGSKKGWVVKRDTLGFLKCLRLWLITSSIGCFVSALFELQLKPKHKPMVTVTFDWAFKYLLIVVFITIIVSVVINRIKIRNGSR